MNQSATAIFKKLSDLEQEVQRLKVQAYFNLPKKQQIISFYPQENITSALRGTRDQMWREKYAKKAQGLS
jgi:hypothetical protein